MGMQLEYPGVSYVQQMQFAGLEDERAEGADVSPVTVKARIAALILSM